MNDGSKKAAVGLFERERRELIKHGWAEIREIGIDPSIDRSLGAGLGDRLKTGTGQQHENISLVGNRFQHPGKRLDSSMSRRHAARLACAVRGTRLLARDKYKVLEAEARALMKSTNMAFDDAFAHVIAEIGGDWDKWKSNLGARNRESKGSAKYKARQELVAHWQSEMTPGERRSLRPECVKSAPSQNLLGAGAAKELAIQHLFEQVSLKRELHIAGMLLRRGIARVSIAEALTWVKSDPFFVRPDPDGKLLTTRQVGDAENKMIQLAAEGQGKHEPLNCGEEWVIRHPLVAASEEQSKAVRHVLGSKDFVISFKGPAGAGKTGLMTEAVTAIESLSSKAS